MVVTKPDEENGEVTDLRELERQTEDTGSKEGGGGASLSNIGSVGRGNGNGFFGGSIIIILFSRMEA